MTPAADLKLLAVLRLRAQAKRYAQDAQDSTLPATLRAQYMQYVVALREQIQQAEQDEKGVSQNKN